jgi:hypothetical protein
MVGLWCLMPLSTIFQFYHEVSFIGGGNRSNQRKPQTGRKSVKLYHIMYTMAKRKKINDLQNITQKTKHQLL